MVRGQWSETVRCGAGWARATWRGWACLTVLHIRIDWGGAPPSPISAKKPFIFSDIGDFLGRNYLILREMTCRYVSTKELRVFLDDGGGGGARRW